MANPVDYASVNVDEDKPPEEYHYTERRAEIFRFVEQSGSPARINQSQLAERYGVTQGQISQDMDALGEFVDEALGQRAKLTTRSMFKRVVDELLDADDWRATKAAWEVVAEWNEWLADIGAQHREPDKSELDVEMDVQTREVAYTVVRGGSVQDFPTDATGGVDYSDLGFTEAPTPVDVAAADGLGGNSGDG